MRLIILGILVMFLFGCAAPIELPFEPPPLEPEKECRMVTEERPFAGEECTNISYTEQVCEKRKLDYISAEPPVVHLCIADGPCVGSPLSECPACAKAMTRCMMVITNNDEDKSGTWRVGAEYTLGDAGFVKDPITQTIGPKESATFDFHQIYVPGQPVHSASCELYVIDEPILDDCHQETRLKRECANVTKYILVEKEVCE